MRRISLKQQILCRTAMDPDTAPANPEEPPADGDTTIQHLPEDCLVENRDVDEIARKFLLRPSPR